jgi:hypothetical protein
MKEETYNSPRSRVDAIAILKEQIDAPPTGVRCLITLNAARYVGTSPVCGRVVGSTFELRNRRDPFCSLRAEGAVRDSDQGSTLTLSWRRPRVPDLIGRFLFRRYDHDRKRILSFLKRWLQITPAR